MNLTDENLKDLIESDVRTAKFQQEQAIKASKFNRSLISDRSLKRQLKMISTVGSVLTETLIANLRTTHNTITNVYNTAKVCELNRTMMLQNCSAKLSLMDLKNIFVSSTDYDILSYGWKEWRSAIGPSVPQQYQHFVNLSNLGFRNGGFNDTGEFWRSWYEDENFQNDVAELWKDILPLYEQLHAYIRNKLQRKYPNRFQTTAIPAHILGNMWSQDWSNIYSFTAPFPHKPISNVTEEMNKQGYTPLKMFHTVNNLFYSMGLTKIPENVWENSILVQPADEREVVCHASAWNFYKYDDHRVKICDQVSMNDLLEIHKQLGHVEYFIQYSEQPISFRRAPNPGFQEAVGDIFALTAGSSSYLNDIGLLPKYDPDTELEMNMLYLLALNKIAFLPFGYLVDKWKWEVFDGTHNISNWNEAWWNLRFQYQGILPPVSRGPHDFDPGAKLDILTNSEYISYFVSGVIRFQFFQSLCDEAGHKGRLHLCELHKSKTAGKKLADMLKLGSSRPWQDAMEQLTGQRRMSADGILSYFRPLMEWLKKENEDECLGWGYMWPTGYNVAEPRCNLTLSESSNSAINGEQSPVENHGDSHQSSSDDFAISLSLTGFWVTMILIILDIICECQ